jgi:choline dehydrogenase-like flavoprotein
MLIDLNEVEGDPVEGVADYCICGAGVAGIVLALELAKHSNVILLEAGGTYLSGDSQDIYKGEIVGRPYFDLALTRLRYFGGSSNHWGGYCRPLDAHDFVPKSYVDFSGWPIRREHLDPYVERAREILDIAGERGVTSSPYDAAEAAIERAGSLQPFAFWWSTPTRFGSKYEGAIRSNPNLTCVLNANVVDIGLVDDHDAVDFLEVRNYAGRSSRVRAKAFIVAAGGIENPRLLLNCNKQIPEGIGNGAGLVGRFFTEHPHHFVGAFLLEDRVKAQLEANWVGARAATRFFAPTVALMEREQILNFGLRVIPSQTTFMRGFRSRLKDLVCSADWIASAAGSLRGEEVNCFDGALRIESESTPNPNSLIRLGSETDRFGMRRVVLDWQLSAIDIHTIRTAAVRFGEAFAQSGAGRVRVEEWILSDDADLPSRGNDEVGGNHHMCTTRMGTTPRDGVVDSDQRVFGIDNLYLAGSSVFATGGHANPTFTIVQMTLRLADHLRA